MSDFKAKMPRSRWRSLQRSTDPQQHLRGPTSKGRGRRGEGEVKGREEQGEGRD